MKVGRSCRSGLKVGSVVASGSMLDRSEAAPRIPQESWKPPAASMQKQHWNLGSKTLSMDIYILDHGDLNKTYAKRNRFTKANSDTIGH